MDKETEKVLQAGLKEEARLAQEIRDTAPKVVVIRPDNSGGGK